MTGEPPQATRSDPDEPDPDGPHPEAASAQVAETRAAIRLLFAIVAVALAMWMLVGFVVHPESVVAGWGRAERAHGLIARGAKRLYATQHAAASFDRTAACGDRRLVWILGSSITREAIDAEELQELLRAGGRDVCVRKYAIDRGAPFFTWAMLDELSLRPGDRVLTSVAYDNFHRDWLDTHKGLHPYLNYLPEPRHLWALTELPVAQRLEYSLSAAPPRGLVRTLPAFREGVAAWWRHQVGGGPEPEEVPPMAQTGKDVIAGFRDQSRWEKTRMSLADLALAPGQLHYDGLVAWRKEVLAAGAEPWVLFVPHSPEYAPQYLSDDLRPAFHAHFADHFAPYVRFGALPQDHYTDFKHLNNDGRAVFTEALAALLLATEPGAPPGEPPPLVPRRVPATQAIDPIRADIERRARRAARRARREQRRRR